MGLCNARIMCNRSIPCYVLSAAHIIVAQWIEVLNGV